MPTSRRLPRAIAAAAAIALLVVPAVDAAKTKPPQKKGATYRGVTSQGASACHASGQDGQPCKVTVAVSKDGKKVKRQLVYWAAQCDDTNVYLGFTGLNGVPIKSGKLHRVGSYDETLADGTKTSNSVETHGTFKHKGGKYTLSGDFTVASDVTFTDGTTTHCASPKVTFKAKP
jgi:hypothetical protein